MPSGIIALEKNQTRFVCTCGFRNPVSIHSARDMYPFNIFAVGKKQSFLGSCTLYDAQLSRISKKLTPLITRVYVPRFDVCLDTHVTSHYLLAYSEAILPCDVFTSDHNKPFADVITQFCNNDFWYVLRRPLSHASIPPKSKFHDNQRQINEAGKIY